ncbi:MAG: bifunctional methionine sulfoxide reductase B/A protein [Marinilabiliales bacterium]|nr:bifunctional methionine sulfoxide reductase B/A protein [Marinilabiliales bacterium]
MKVYQMLLLAAVVLAMQKQTVAHAVSSSPELTAGCAGSVGQDQPQKKKSTLMKTDDAKKEGNPYYSRIETKPLHLTDSEWKKILPPDLYQVSRQKGTERAFTGKYWDFKGIGTYFCAACGRKLFRSDAKFSSECGWPSFFEQADPQSIVFEEDNSHGMHRTEALCGRCGGHLGHLFDDGPLPTHKRYCMNSIALEFVPDEWVAEPIPAKLDTITLGGGCFWCTEEIYRNLKGVTSVVSGYSGGEVAHPTYREVCTGETGHAEVVQVVYDPGKIGLEEILRVFFTVHDPTTLNRQGADVGTQYRSVVFYHHDQQRKMAKEVIAALDQSEIFNRPIVTQVVPFSSFYKAEDYHQAYYQLHKNEPYCRMVIEPKVDKFRKIFKELAR